MRSPKKLRIFLGITDSCNIFGDLSDAFTELGVYNRHVNLSLDLFSMRTTVPGRLEKMLLFTTGKARSAKKISYAFWAILSGLLSLVMFLWTVFGFNVIILCSGTNLFSFFPICKNLDLAIYKILQKRIIFYFVGSDSRAPYMEPATYEYDIEHIVQATQKSKRQHAIWEKYGDVIIDNPASSHLWSKSHINIFFINFIQKCPMPLPVSCTSSDSIRILHAPSSKVLKGTAQVRTIVSRLQKEGYKINYIELSRSTHSDVLKEIEKADIVFDQLYCDTPMARFAAEACSAGKPVVVGGNDVPFIRGVIPKHMQPPTIFVHPDQVESELRKLICDPSLCSRVGETGYKFIKEQMNPHIIAQKFISLINNEYPNTWIYQPAGRVYRGGFGSPDYMMEQIITQMKARCDRV